MITTSTEGNVTKIEKVFYWSIKGEEFGYLTQKGASYVKELVRRLKSHQEKEDTFLKEIVSYFDLE